MKIKSMKEFLKWEDKQIKLKEKAIITSTLIDDDDDDL